MTTSVLIRGVFASMADGPQPGESYQDTMFRMMLDQKCAGNKIVLGFDVALATGQVVLKMEHGQAVIAARSTRAEYLLQAAPGSEPDKFERSPFYYEVDLIEVGKPAEVTH